MNKTGNKNKRLQILIPVWVFIIIFIIILIIIIPSTKEKIPSESAEVAQETTAEVDVREKAATVNAEQTSDGALTGFFADYYDALSKGDKEALAQMFDDPEEAVSSDAMASLIDEYKNLRIYSAEGLNADEYAVFVYNDVKFKNIDTIAPSVDSFYVSNASGGYKIVSDMFYDPDIAEYLTLLSEKDPVREVMINTEAWLETSLANDSTLKDMYEQMKNAISDSGE